MIAQPRERAGQALREPSRLTSGSQQQFRDFPGTGSLEAQAEPWPQLEGKAAWATEREAGSPRVTWLSELEVLRCQLRDSAARLANEQDCLVAEFMNRLRGGLLSQYDFAQPGLSAGNVSEGPQATAVRRLPPTFLPLLGLSDPPRSSSIEALHTIEVSQVSGDSAFTDTLVHNVKQDVSSLFSGGQSRDEVEDEELLRLQALSRSHLVMQSQKTQESISMRASSVSDFAATTNLSEYPTGPSLKCAGLRRKSRMDTERLSITMMDMVERFSAHEMTPMKRLLIYCVSLMTWFEHIQEPQREWFLARLINSKHFEALCITVISLNGLFIIRVANHEIQQVLLGSPAMVTDVNLFGEALFTCFYLVELSLRCAVHRLYFFCNEAWKWNIFDLALVLSSTAHLVTEFVFTERENGESTNVMFLRVCRIFKMAKVIRMFRALKFVSDLRMMVDSVCGSFFALFWCIVLILFVLYIFALFFVQSIANFLSSSHDTLSEKQISNIYAQFGSVEAAILSLFQATTGGENWRQFYETVSYAGPLQAVLFIFYIAFFVVAAWNIVTSTFVEKAFKIAQPDIESLLLEKRHKDIADGKEFLKLLAELDNGRQRKDRISMKEFLDLAENGRFLDFFHVRGVDIKDAEMFFRMLASVSDDEDVELSTFVAGCLRMKGLATSIDLHTLSFETKSMVMKQRQMFSQIDSRLRRFEKRLCQLRDRFGQNLLRETSPTSREDFGVSALPTRL